MKKVILFFVLGLLISSVSMAETLMIPPSSFKTNGCREIYPLTKIGRENNATCYVYATINLPGKVFANAINIRYEALDSSCVLQSELRSLDMEGNNSILAANTYRGTTSGIADVDMEGLNTNYSNAYMLGMRLMNASQCYIYGVEIEY